MTKTLEEKHLDKHAPVEPLEYEQVDNARRTECKLLKAISEAEDLIKARGDGSAVEIGRCTVFLSKLDKARLFGMVWESVLKNLTYWEHHARRYVKLPKHIKQRLQSVRTQIGYWQNPEG